MMMTMMMVDYWTITTIYLSVVRNLPSQVAYWLLYCQKKKKITCISWQFCDVVCSWYEFL
jgi:hypothetical protein